MQLCNYVMMQFEQARQMPLAKILMKLGFETARTSRAGEELWYHSPFRDEKTPSFKVDVRRNIWFDFGEGVGGSPIDLIQHVFSTNIQGALKVLSDFENTSFQNYEKQTPSVKIDVEAPLKDVFQLEKVASFEKQNTSLHHYIITERCIDAMIAQPFLKTVFFKHLPTGKSYTAVGIKNTEGGYEVRNPFFKGAIPESRKGFSWFPTVSDNERIVCFEGFVDFLSYGTFFGWGQEDYLVLNSVAFSKKAVEFLNSKDYKQIQTYFDNDAAGEKATFLFQESLENVERKNAVFEGHKDFNAFLVHFKNALK